MHFYVLIIQQYSIEYKKQPKTSTNIPNQKTDYRYELMKVQDINALEISKESGL